MKSNGQHEGFTLTSKKLDGYIAAIVTIWLVATIGIPVFSWLSPDIELGDFALLGDSLGTINAFFSALAVIVVVLSLRLQQREIEETLALMRAERSEEKDRQFRAATPILISGNFRHLSETGGGSAMHCLLTNNGQTIFDPTMTVSNAEDLEHISVETKADTILPNNSHIQVIVKPMVASQSLPKHLTICLTLQCFDIDGRKRTLHFEGRPVVTEKLKLTAYDFLPDWGGDRSA